MRYVRLLMLLLVSILAVLFAAQNGAEATVVFFAWKTTASLSLILVLTLAIGIALGLIVAIPGLVSRSIKNSRLKSRFRKLEKETGTLKARSEDCVDESVTKGTSETVPQNSEKGKDAEADSSRNA